MPGSSPSTMFSQTVKLSASMKCWNTMPMPAAMASRGRAEVLLDAVDDDRALVGPVGAVERLHQRRLAGAVLADDGVDRAGAHRQVDAVVGDDAGEALDDVPQLDRDRRRSVVGVRPSVDVLADRRNPIGKRPSACVERAENDRGPAVTAGPRRADDRRQVRRHRQSGCRRHLDLAGDDLLLEVLELSAMSSTKPPDVE